MPNVRFPSTNKEFTAGQLADGSAQIPTQVYIILLEDSSTVADNYTALIGSFNAHFGGEWDHRAMFGGKIISGVLDLSQVAWLLSNDGGVIKVIEADGQVGIA